MRSALQTVLIRHIFMFMIWSDRFRMIKCWFTYVCQQQKNTKFDKPSSYKVKFISPEKVFL